MRSRIVLVVFIAWPLGAAAPQQSARTVSLRLSRIFGDGMVIQRNKPVVVWGWAAPGSPVSVALHGHTARVVTKPDGKWKANFPAERAGGPYELAVRSGDDHLELHDVLVGDMWVASGQSNMEFTLAQALNGTQAIASAHDSLLRQFKVPNSWADAPEDDLAGGSWAPADPQHAGDFSAVAYFFARDLRTSERVPIGIVNTTWGGSNIETWISRAAQREAA